MSPRARGTSSFPIVQLIAGLIGVLALGIVLAVLFAPEKPPAPPKSITTYVDHPEAKGPEDPLEAAPWTPRRRSAGGADTRRASVSQESAAAPDAPFALTGVVLDAKNGAPLPGARVTAQRIWTAEEERDWRERGGGEPRRRGPEGGASREALEAERRKLQFVARGQTDAEGRFKLAISESGRYRVDVRLEEYVDAQQDTEALGPDKRSQELRFELSTGARITGRVVEEGSSKGAPGVRVYLEETPRTDAQTDEQGNFTLTGIRPGQYGLTVSLAGTEYRPGKKLPYQKVNITSPDQVLSNIRFEVEAAGVVWGYVMTPDKQPVRGAEVVLSTSESPLTQLITAALRQAPPIRSRSGDDGYYELLGVPLNKEWRAYAQSNEHTPQLADPFLLTPQNRSVRVDIFLFGGSNISGTVVDEKRQPIPEADVVLLPAYAKLLSPLDQAQAFRNERSDAAGNFTIREVPAGDYQILARKRGYKFSAQGEPVYPDGYDAITGLQITLVSVTQGENSVFGQVVDRNDAPIASADIELRGYGTETMQNIATETTTDSSGAFRIDGLEAGMYSLRVTKEGFAPGSLPRVPLNQQVRVVLDTSAVVRGRVLVAETRLPPTPEFFVNPRPLTVMIGGGMRGPLQDQRFATPDGSFEVALPGGEWIIEGKAAGMTPGRVAVSLAPGEVVENVEILLSAVGGRIAGTVRTMDGETPQGAEVLLAELSAGAGVGVDGGAGRMQVGADGRFEFTQLAEGMYNVIARHPNYANASSGPISLATAQTIDNIALRLGQGGILEGNVYRRGKPLEGALVLILGADTGVSMTATTDASGYYVVDGLATGMYEVTATMTSSGGLGDVFDRQGASVQVIEGQTARLDFGLSGGTRITGLCTPPPPPPAGGEVFLRAPGSPPIAMVGESVRADATRNVISIARTGIGLAGNFEFEPVPPGIYQVEVLYLLNVFDGGLELRSVYAGIVQIPDAPVAQIPISVSM